MTPCSLRVGGGNINFNVPPPKTFLYLEPDRKLEALVRLLIRKDNLIDESKIYVYKKEGHPSTKESYHFVDIENATADEMYAIIMKDEERVFVFDNLEDAKLFITFKE